jgi:hypothetical protein
MTFSKSIALLFLGIALCGCRAQQRQAEVVLCKPNELRVSSVSVFQEPRKTHEYLAEYRMVFHFPGDRNPDWLKFLPNRRFKGQHTRSALPPQYEFEGVWRLTNDGFLELEGKFVNFEKAFEPHLPAKQPFKLVVTELEYVPSAKQVRLSARLEKDIQPGVQH